MVGTVLTNAPRSPHKFISIPLFSPGNVTFPPAIQLAPVGISVPAFDSQSDLRYVPTLRTFLLYKCFFIRRGSGAEAPVLPAVKKSQISIAGIFPRNRGDFSPQFRGFSPALAGIFPAIFLENLQVKIA